MIICLLFFIFPAARKEEKNSNSHLILLLILFFSLSATNHYAENKISPVWGKEGLLTQQMTAFLYPLKVDGAAPTVYESGTDGITLGEETVTRMQEFLILEETVHRSCRYMAVNVTCTDHPEYSGVAKNLYETAMFLHDFKMLPDNKKMTPAWIEDKFMNGSFIFADGWHLETSETGTVGITSENDLWARAQWNVDRNRTLDTSHSCLSDGSVTELDAKIGSTAVVADDTDGGQGTVPIFSTCSWKITPETEPTSGRIQLNFTLLSLERDSDFLEIIDVNTNRIVAKFTGRTWDPMYRREGTLPTLVTPGGPISIQLTTDGTDDQPIGFTHNDGFAATFHELAAGTVATAAGACATVGAYGANCKQNSCFGTSEYQLKNKQDIITFASNVAGEKYESSSTCMWFISGPPSSDSSGTSVLLTFEQLSTQFHYDQIKIYAEDDITKFHDTTNLVAVLSGEYGTELRPLPTIQVHGNKVAIVFSSDGAVADSGFQVKVQSSTLECTTDADCGGGGADRRSKCDLTSRQCRCDSGWSGLGKKCFSPVCLTTHLQPVTPVVSEETQTGFIRSNVVNYKYESDAACRWLFEKSTIDSTLGVSTIGVRFSLHAWDVEESDKMEIVLYHEDTKEDTEDPKKKKDGRRRASGKDKKKDASSGSSTTPVDGGGDSPDKNDLVESIKYTVVDLKDGKCKCGIVRNRDDQVVLPPVVNIDSNCSRIDDCYKNVDIEITNNDWVKIEVRFDTDINIVADGFVFKYALIRRPCDPGEYNVNSLPAGHDNQGKPGCLKCNAGSYNDDGNAFQCTACPKGFEGKEEGSDSCKECRTSRTGGTNTFALLPSQKKCAVDHDEVEFNADNKPRCLKGVWFPTEGHLNPVREIEGGSYLRPIRMGYNRFRESSFRLTDYFAIVFLEMLGYLFELVPFDSDALVLTALSSEEIDMALEAWIETGAVDLDEEINIVSLGNAEYRTGPAWFYCEIIENTTSYLYRQAFDVVNVYKNAKIVEEMMSEVDSGGTSECLENAGCWESTACKESGKCIDVFTSDKCLKNVGTTCEDFDDATLLSIVEDNGLAVRSRRKPDDEFETFIMDRNGGSKRGRTAPTVPSIFHSHEPSAIMSELSYLREIDLKLEKKHTVQMLTTTSFLNDANFNDAVNLLNKHRFTNAMMVDLMKADIRVLPNNDYSAACVYAQTCVAALSMNAKDTRPKAIYIGTVKGDVVSELKGTIFSNMLKDVFKLDVFLQPVPSSMALLWGLYIGDIDIALSFKPASGEELYPYMLKNGEIIVESISDATDDVGLYSMLIGGKDNSFCDQTCQDLIHTHYLSLYQTNMIASLPTMNTLATLTESTAAMNGTLLCDPQRYSWCTAQPGTRGMYIPEQCATASPPCGEIYATSLEALYRPAALEELVAAHDYKLAVVFTTQEKIAEVIKRSQYYGGIGEYNHIMMASCPQCSSYHYVSKAVSNAAGGGGDTTNEFQKVTFKAWNEMDCSTSLITSRVLQRYHTVVTELMKTPVESLTQSSCTSTSKSNSKPAALCFDCDTNPTAAEVTLRGSRAPEPGQLKQLDQLLSEFDVSYAEMETLLSLHESMPGGTLTTKQVATHYDLNAKRSTKSEPSRILSDVLFRVCDDQDGYYGYWGICQACPVGKYGPPGANECIDCSPGTYAPNTGHSECDVVNDNEFVDGFGANQTKLCGERSASGGSVLVTVGVEDPGGVYCRCLPRAFKDALAPSTTDCTFAPTGSLPTFCAAECRSKNTPRCQGCYCNSRYTGGHVPGTCNTTTNVWIMPDTTFQGIYAAPGYWQNKSKYNLDAVVNQSSSYTLQDRVNNDEVWTELRFRECTSNYACPALSNDTAACDNGFTGAICGTCAPNFVASVMLDEEGRPIPACLSCDTGAGDLGPIIGGFCGIIAFFLLISVVGFVLRKKLKQKKKAEKAAKAAKTGEQKKDKKTAKKKSAFINRLIDFYHLEGSGYKVEGKNVSKGSAMDFHMKAEAFDKNWGVKIKLALGFSQIQNAFFKILPISYSNQNKQVETASNSANIDLTAFTAISCVTGKFFNQLLFITVMPLLFGVVLPFLAYVIGRNCVKDKTTLLGQCLTAVIAVLIAAYPGTSKKVFTTFICDDDFVGDKVGYLKADYTYRCDDPEYLSWRGYALVMVFIFPIGIPIALTITLLWLFCKRKMYSRDDEGNVIVHDQVPIPQDFAAQIFGNLFLGIDANCFWFESYDMFRKLMLTSLLALLFDDLNSQIIVAALFVLFNLCVTAIFQPYTHSSTDRLSFYLCLSLLLMLIAGMGHNFSKLLYEQAISSGDVNKLVTVEKDLSTTMWQNLIFAANIFGYAFIAFEFLTHPYHLLEHHASFLTIKYGTRVGKNDVAKALFGYLDRKHPSYGPILEHHTDSMATTKVTPLSDSVNVVDESSNLKSLKNWDNSSEN